MVGIVTATSKQKTERQAKFEILNQAIPILFQPFNKVYTITASL
ncbi:MAG: hypothetical protein ACI86M_000263 [Saprospiraceae bacterium]|jgi:hypothetical protein